MITFAVAPDIFDFMCLLFMFGLGLMTAIGGVMKWAEANAVAAQAHLRMRAVPHSHVAEIFLGALCVLGGLYFSLVCAYNVAQVL